ncbi:MAG: GNAT family N-acetyltransferase [Nitrospirota bacterium]
MENKESPKMTGISEITGKMVRVRHATEADLVFIEERLKEHHFDTETLDYREFVVATEDGELIGLGRLKKTGEIYQIGCVIVVEEKRQRGIGSLIVKHLMDYAPVKIVYVLTDWVDYFKELGFVEIKEGAKELYDVCDAACRVGGKQKTTFMACEKS